nr:hypothetical protein BaRGS_011914 [Batillaria attramentaria]
MDENRHGDDDTRLGGECQHEDEGSEVEDDVYSQLAQKEQDLFLAAELGKALLEKNAELEQRNAALAEECTQKTEELEQERYTLQMQLAQRQAEYESTIKDLQDDLKVLQDQLSNHDNEVSAGNRKHTQDLRQLQQHNEVLSEQLRQQELEVRIRTVTEERDALAAELEDLQEYVLMLEKQRQRQESQQMHNLDRVTSLSAEMLDEDDFECDDDDYIYTDTAMTSSSFMTDESGDFLDSPGLHGDASGRSAEHQPMPDTVLDMMGEAGAEWGEGTVAEKNQKHMHDNHHDRSVGSHTDHDRKSSPGEQRRQLALTEELQMLLMEMDQQKRIQELQKERDALQDKACGGLSPSEVLQQTRSERDAAFKRVDQLEHDLAQSRQDVASLGGQLMAAIQQKVSISQELDQWQVDLSEVLMAQMHSRITEQQRAEQAIGQLEKQVKAKRPSPIPSPFKLHKK